MSTVIAAPTPVIDHLTALTGRTFEVQTYGLSSMTQNVAFADNNEIVFDLDAADHGTGITDHARFAFLNAFTGLDATKAFIRRNVGVVGGIDIVVEYRAIITIRPNDDVPTDPHTSRHLIDLSITVPGTPAITAEELTGLIVAAVTRYQADDDLHGDPATVVEAITATEDLDAEDFAMVLNDGETWTGVGSCSIQAVAPDPDTGDLEPTGMPIIRL